MDWQCRHAHYAVGLGKAVEADRRRYQTDDNEQLELAASQVEAAGRMPSRLAGIEALAGRLSSSIRIQVVLPGMREALRGMRHSWRRRGRWPSGTKRHLSGRRKGRKEMRVCCRIMSAVMPYSATRWTWV